MAGCSLPFSSRNVPKGRSHDSREGFAYTFYIFRLAWRLWRASERGRRQQCPGGGARYWWELNCKVGYDWYVYGFQTCFLPGRRQPLSVQCREVRSCPHPQSWEYKVRGPRRHPYVATCYLRGVQCLQTYCSQGCLELYSGDHTSPSSVTVGLRAKVAHWGEVSKAREALRGVSWHERDRPLPLEKSMVFFPLNHKQQLVGSFVKDFALISDFFPFKIKSLFCLLPRSKTSEN